jgi:hypothetical protein
VETGVDLALASFTALSALIQHSCPNSNDVIFSKLVPLLQQIELTFDHSKFPEHKASSR